jgi:hypothetical protein
MILLKTIVEITVCPMERILIDDFSPRHVNQKGTRLHQPKLYLVDPADRLRAPQEKSFNDISPAFYPGVPVCSVTRWVSRSEGRGPSSTTSAEPAMNVALSEARKTMPLALS